MLTPITDVISFGRHRWLQKQHSAVCVLPQKGVRRGMKCKMGKIFIIVGGCKGQDCNKCQEGTSLNH